LWDHNKASVIEHKDVDGVIKAINYLYANPASANLVDCIERYPGASSWEVFQKAEDSLTFSHTDYIPRIRLSKIRKLPSISVNDAQDKRLVQLLKQDKKYDHELTLYPNAWMKAFNLGDEDVREQNENIKAALRQREENARLLRNQNGKKTMGATKLKTESLNLTYRPKRERERRIFVYAACTEARIAAIEEYKEYFAECDRCYECWRIGDYTVEWPLGAFLPHCPPRYNWFGCGDPYSFF
jgi:hypothetical protein